ncbi:MAG: hypothetical protein PHP55_08830, partial [Methanoculleus sp.]|nr:hypothetical protein [Methanoculleus sp.]
VPAPEIKDLEVLSEGKDTGVESLLCGIDVVIIDIISPYNRPQRVVGVLAAESIQRIFRPGRVGSDCASPVAIYLAAFI